MIALLGLAVFSGLVFADVRDLDYPHNATNNISCMSCHYTTGDAPSWVNHTPVDIDDTPWFMITEIIWEDGEPTVFEYTITDNFYDIEFIENNNGLVSKITCLRST